MDLGIISLNPDKVLPDWPADCVHIVLGTITDPAAIDNAVRRGAGGDQRTETRPESEGHRSALGEGTRLIVTSMQRILSCPIRTCGSAKAPTAITRVDQGERQIEH
jgi:hypothetical protein